MNKPLGAIDKSVRVPSAVARQAAAADAAQKALLGQGEPAPEPENNPAPEPDPQPQPEPDPKPEPTPQPQAEVIPPNSQLANGDDWKVKYERQQGRVVALEKSNNDFRERVNNLERVIATLQATAPAAPEPTSEPERYVTDEDVNTYGPEFFDAVERKAREMIAPLKRELEGKLTQLGTQVGGVTQIVQKDAQEMMKERITREVPNWIELNTNPDFVAWCNEEDPLTGVDRLAMLRTAWERNDGPRVANFFKAYLREQEAVQTDEPPAGSGRDPAAPTVTLGAFAAPGKAKTASAPKDAPAKQPITRQFITQFYADVSAGKYRHNDARRVEIERDIFDAQREGRIT